MMTLAALHPSATRGPQRKHLFLNLSLEELVHLAPGDGDKTSSHGNKQYGDEDMFPSDNRRL